MGSPIHLGGTARTPAQVRRLHELGLQFAEIPIQELHEFSQQMALFLALKEELGLYYLCHGPQEGDPNDIARLRGEYLPKLTSILPLMVELEMKLLTVHLWLDPRFVRKDVLPFKVALLKELTEKAADTGITVCIENLSERASHLEVLLLNAPLLMLTLDLGHAQLLSEVNVSLEFMNKYPDRIRHVHLHDNRGGDSPREDLHLPIGEGSIDFKPIFARLLGMAYTGTLTLELKPHEIAECLDRVRSLLHRQGPPGR